MTLEEFKTIEIGRNAQSIIFDELGRVIESDDILIELSGSEFNVFDDTMFSGMQDAFKMLSIGEDLKFDCIETEIMDRKSYYDFLVKRIPDQGQEKRWGWIVFDYSDQYKKVLELQQERNLAEMQYNKIERESTKLKEEKDAIQLLYKELLKDSNVQYTLVKSDNLLINLDLKDILFFEAYGDYIKVHTKNKMYVTYNTMKSIEVSLPKNQFFRIHRSYIVRLDKVKNIEQLSADIGDKVLPIGKNHKASLIQKIGQL